jgi:hypothetical protein
MGKISYAGIYCFNSNHGWLYVVVLQPCPGTNIFNIRHNSTILISVFSGGMRTAITGKDITIRDNILGLRLLRLKIDEISDIVLTEFKLKLSTDRHTL